MADSSSSASDDSFSEDVDKVMTQSRRVALAMAVAVAVAIYQSSIGQGRPAQGVNNADTDQFEDYEQQQFDHDPYRIEDDYGKTYTQRLLEDPVRLHEVSRLHKDAFLKLAAWLRDHGHVVGGRLCSVEQKLLIFLMIVGQGAFYRGTGSTLRHSISTISRVFHEVLPGLCELHKVNVRLPDISD